MSKTAEIYVTIEAYELHELVNKAIRSFGQGNGLPNSSGKLQDADTDMVTQVNEFLTALSQRIDEIVSSAEDVSNFINGNGHTSIYDIASV